MASHLMNFPTPKNLNWSYVFGGILVLFLVIQIVTGIVLAMHYQVGDEASFRSVEHIMRDVNGGWLLRYAHANGASFFFIAVYAHIFRGLYYGSYKAPRELLWIIGVLIYVVMMATAFMGYVLPWGQMSFWGAKVITSLFGAIPLVGGHLTEWLWGGPSVGEATLNRMFSLHYLLPFVIAGLTVLHIWALHHVGNTNPTGVDIRKDSLPFYAIKDLYAIVIFLIFFVAFTFFAPNYLGHPDNYIEANPLVTPAHIVPEWYFLPFYAILRAITAKLGGVLAMFGAIAVLAFVPWLDTSRVRSTTYRPIYRWWFILLVVDFFVLMWVGGKPAEGIYTTISVVATAYWFIHFLVVLPIVGLIEKPKARPETVEAAFRAKHGGKSGSDTEASTLQPAE
ncbi:UNVERIFIED_CONTAM: hypothetical protein GTU68_064448 [Idotea baltica]|nr:hypothetical protein [Idotea baltica]